ncbi:hydroxymethylbilane synthase [Paeniclostridium sordellii]|uniref:hydroxymethylbilane synthase n=1 Tax=Paraclostridium sordellii TaxID=1505 RepID=UPI0005DA84D9|nr:hydroxymethylbilane synthase [Paeniclostridium sordellii]MBX9183121.1 hydroxymethylbilane synthase [Paeniclostridium sordellii]MDU2689020.1 hydroxymethylbilane synthase [Paeniclostridium sordellii]MDU6247662.1 hydroxymethylbilane synthase [Paeniclostridium sordellii]MVO71384.1 hydroxymethylbilane synthase [Paeniclostridium sordellii]CEN92320.1 porphobilinogen deaminase [[Clostridium] sordellii] [Paeniclostridium sordellii]
MKIVVGSRGSNLALTQTNWVISELKKHHPNIEFEVKIIKTKGDLIQNVSLDKIGDKGLFVKEIEQQLIDKKIDIAVHSMKDMPSSLPEGLKFAGIPKREDIRDVLILKEGYSSLEDLPNGAKIGSGSKRRKYQLLKHRPDLDIVPIRGNIETRMRKIEDENLCGVILAAAGLIRAGLKDKISCYLDVDKIIPAPAQGALGIEIRQEDPEVEKILDCLTDKVSEIQVSAERGFLDGINGSCHIPIGAYCEVNGENINLTGLYGDEEGKKLITKTISGKALEAREVGIELAKLISKEFKSYER